MSSLPKMALFPLVAFLSWTVLFAGCAGVAEESVAPEDIQPEHDGFILEAKDINVQSDSFGVAEVSGEADVVLGPDSWTDANLPIEVVADAEGTLRDAVPGEDVPLLPDFVENVDSEWVDVSPECTGDDGACDDGDHCTVDACVEQSCQHSPLICGDDDECNGVEGCHPDVGCVDGQPIQCGDGDPCNGEETCDASSGECLPGIPLECDDGDPCNGQEACDGGVCQGGVAIQCDDGQFCNGVEVCDSVTGNCVDGDVVDCGDGDGCNGVEVCNGALQTCVSEVLACPEALSSCNQGASWDSATSGSLQETLFAGFRLSLESPLGASQPAIDAIASHWSTTPVTLDTVLSDLNRQATSITTGNPCFYRGWMWNEGDGEVDYWWPQGVTGAGDAYSGFGENGTYGGKQLMLVSWYHKAEEDGGSDFYKGARVSLVDHSNPNDIAYRHLLLVKPELEGSVASYGPLATTASSLHAGGIVWYQNWLYVADTTVGLRVFDMDQILAVQTGNKNKIGYDSSSDSYQAYNYAYIVPEVARYKLCDEGCCARFSFVSLDASTDPPSLLAGEYSKAEKSGRLHRWPLDPSTGLLGEIGGAVTAEQVLFLGVEMIQGGLSYEGNFFLSSSKPKTSWVPSPGTFYHATVGQSWTQYEYPYLPEDLYYAPLLNEIWTCTESPNTWTGNTRYCLSFLLSDVLSGCD